MKIVFALYPLLKDDVLIVVENKNVQKLKAVSIM